MKKYYLKIKSIVYGFPATVNEYKIDNFILKSRNVDEVKMIDQIKQEEIEDDEFSFTSYLMLFIYRLEEDKKLYYNYFESIKDIEVAVEDECSSIFDTTNYIFHKSGAFQTVFDLEKQLRLIFNLRIKFPMIRVKIYDEYGQDYNQMSLFRDIPNTHGLDGIDKNIFEFNSHFYFNIKGFEKLSNINTKFEKAISYYFNSFDSNDISIRFILLVTALEALVINDEKNIKSKLINRISNLLKDIYKDKDISNRIKYFYKIRSEYIHGDKRNIIKKEDEKELREYTRNALIIYWYYSLNTNYNAGKIISNLNNNVDLDVTTKMTAQYMNTTDYKKAFSDAISIFNNLKK